MICRVGRFRVIACARRSYLSVYIIMEIYFKYICIGEEFVTIIRNLYTYFILILIQFVVNHSFDD